MSCHWVQIANLSRSMDIVKRSGITRYDFPVILTPEPVICELMFDSAFMPWYSMRRICTYALHIQC